MTLVGDTGRTLLLAKTFKTLSKILENLQFWRLIYRQLGKFILLFKQKCSARLNKCLRSFANI